MLVATLERPAQLDACGDLRRHGLFAQLAAVMYSNALNTFDEACGDAIEAGRLHNFGASFTTPSSAHLGRPSQRRATLIRGGGTASRCRASKLWKAPAMSTRSLCYVHKHRFVDAGCAHAEDGFACTAALIANNTVHVDDGSGRGAPATCGPLEARVDGRCVDADAIAKHSMTASSRPECGHPTCSWPSTCRRLAQRHSTRSSMHVQS